MDVYLDDSIIKYKLVAMSYLEVNTRSPNNEEITAIQLQ